MTIIELIQRSHNAFIMFGYLIEASNNGKDEVTASYQAIADTIGLSVKGVRIAIETLEKMEVVAKIGAKSTTKSKPLIMCYKLSGCNLIKNDSGKVKGKVYGKEKRFQKIDNPTTEPQQCWNAWIDWMNDDKDARSLPQRLYMSYEQYEQLFNTYGRSTLSAVCGSFCTSQWKYEYTDLFFNMNKWCNKRQKSNDTQP